MQDSRILSDKYQKLKEWAEKAYDFLCDCEDDGGLLDEFDKLTKEEE